MNFSSGSELIELCEAHHKSISKIMMEREEQEGLLSHQDNIAKMVKCIQIMRESSTAPIDKPIKSIGGLIGGEAKKLATADKKYSSLCGPLISKAMTYSMAVLETNATMGLIVAAPTAGSSGIVPGVLLAAHEELGGDEDKLISSLYNASAIGYLLMRNSSVSGAEAGCQAEVGSAAAMASSALTEYMGGTPSQCLTAAALSISNLLGLVCDPIAGLVECPCQTRNVIGVSDAISSAQLSLCGIEFCIPFDQMAETMKRVGVRLPYELRETALGGCAATPAAAEISKRIKS